MGPDKQIPVPIRKTVTGKFYKNDVVRKLKDYCKRRRSKTGPKYLRVLHDNAPGHNRKMLPSNFLCFHQPRLPISKTHISYIWKKMPFDSYLSVSDRCHHWRVWTVLPKIYRPAKKVYSNRWECFEGKCKLKWSKQPLLRKTNASVAFFWNTLRFYQQLSIMKSDKNFQYQERLLRWFDWSCDWHCKNVKG